MALEQFMQAVSGRNLSDEIMGRQTQDLSNRISEYKLQSAQQSSLVEAQKEQAYKEAVGQFIKNPTAEGAANLSAAFPDRHEAIKQSWDMRTSEARNADERQLSIFYSQLNAGKVEDAKKALQSRIDADKAAGIDTSDDEEILATFESDPTGATAKGVAALLLSGGPNGDKFKSLLGKGGETHVINPGGALVDDAGNELYRAAPGQKFEKVKNADGTESIVPLPSEGGQGAPATGAAIEEIALAAVPGAVVTSRQRSADKNRSVGGVPNSYHLTDQARDFVPPPGMSMGQLASSLNERLGSDFQVINEKDHVHVEPRRRSGGGQTGAIYTSRAGNPQDSSRPMTTEEKAQWGLPAGVAYKMGKGGPILIGGQDLKTKNARPLTQGTIDKLTPRVEVRDTLKRLGGTFQDAFGGNTFTGPVENWMQAVAGTGTPGQRDWWADFYSMDNQIRNDLFGAALTASEQKAYEQTTISPRMSAKQIRTNLSRRDKIISGALERQKRVLLANKADPDAVEALFSPIDVDASPAASSPPTGATAARRNPQTGQTAYLVGGKWVVQ